MPVIQPYEQQVLPKGQLDVQANAADFGAAVGQGISNAGQGIEEAGNSVLKVNEEKGQIWAINQASSVAADWTQKMSAMRTDPDFTKKYGADGSGFTDAVKTGFEDYANQAIADAPTPQAKKYLDQHLHRIGQSMMADAVGFQATVGATWATNQLTQSLDNYGRTVFQDHTKYDTMKGLQDSAIDAMPHLDEDAKLKLKKQAQTDLAFAAGKGAALADPSSVLSSLQPGELAQLNPTARQTAIINGNTKVQLPVDAGADIVKPYNASKIAEVAQLTKTASPYDDLFKKAGEAYGVDPNELKMRAAAESKLDPSAVSSQGAVGIMQLTPATAASLGVADPKDPQEAIFGAAKLLSSFGTEAKGNTTVADKMYYGGQSGTNWGPNTVQYAENLAAVRATMTGGEAVHSTYDQVLASVSGDKAPVQAANAPSWFNSLDWQHQAAVIEDAKQGVSAERTRTAQQLELQEKMRVLAQKQTMSTMMDQAMDNTLTPDMIRKDGTLDFEGKKQMLEMLQSGLAGPGRKDPAAFNDAFNRIHAPDGTPDKITDESQLASMVGHGIDYEQLKQLREELQGRGTNKGELIGDLKKDFLKKGYDQLVTTDMFKAVDPTQADNYYNFQQAFLTKFDDAVKKGKSPLDLLSPSSPDYMGGMIQQFQRTPQQVSAAMADAMRKQNAPQTIKVINPEGKIGTIPASQLDDALKSGYKKAP